MSSIFNEPFREPLNFFGMCNNSDGEGSVEKPIAFHHRQPSEGEDKRELDALLSQAMNGLSFQERQQQQDILHGVDQVVEDDAFMDRALQELDQHLSYIKRGSAYEMAEMMDPGYVHERAFRLMFLRANEYNAEASADQMLRFFDIKHQLFGDEKLTQDITMKDLDEGDIASLNTGWLHLAGRDRSGRQVFVHIGGLMGNTLNKTVQNDCRVQFFMVMKALQSEETQKRGTVSIWFAMGDFKNRSNGKGYFECFMTARALPQKKAAIHVCFDDITQGVLAKTLLKMMNSNMRARVKLHHGSSIECQYKLTSYGILSQSWPMDSNGTMKFDRHRHWVRQQAIEDGLLVPSSSPMPKQSSPPGSPQPSLPGSSDLPPDGSPGPNDVLFTGGKVRNHSGTLAFRELIKVYSKEYDSGSDETKRQVADQVIERIQESGGRFLRQTKNSTHWEQVPLAQVRKKIMQTFRNRRRVDGNKSTISSSNGTLIADSPRPNDVIFGRAYRNPGSELLHRLVKHHFEEYESLDRGVKIQLVDSIMQSILGQGGRFLQPMEGEGGFLELSHDSARDRISKYFRNQRRYARPGQ